VLQTIITTPSLFCNKQKLLFSVYIVSLSKYEAYISIAMHLQAM